MIKVFIDSDIILELLLKRNNYESVANKNKSIENINKLRKFISILTINEEIIDDALSHNAIDFEDSIQYKTFHPIPIIVKNKALFVFQEKIVILKDNSIISDKLIKTKETGIIVDTQLRIV